MQNMEDMPYVRGIKVRIFPSDKQRRIININIGAQRFVYNSLVKRYNEIFWLKKVKIYCEPVAARLDYLESLSELPSNLMNSYPFLAEDEIDSQAIANGIKNYHAAWDQFRKVPGTSIPTFHKKRAEGSYQTNPHYKKEATRINQCNVHFAKDDCHITIPKLGAVHFKDSGALYNMFQSDYETRIGTITISRDACGDFYASFQISSVHPFKDSLEKTDSVIGIDMNVKNFYTDSRGNVVDNPKYLSKQEAKLAKEQRRLSRRQRRAINEKRSLYTSKNYQKQRLKVARIHRKIARQREAFQQELSKKMINSHDMIIAEDLKEKNLLKNHCLAKSIADCSWSSFFRMLKYKAEWYGRKFIQVPPHYTTQTCSCCGYVMSGEQKITLDMREWTCPSCGAWHDRDQNSAINMLTKGLAVTA